MKNRRIIEYARFLSETFVIKLFNRLFDCTLKIKSFPILIIELRHLRERKQRPALPRLVSLPRFPT